MKLKHIDEQFYALECEMRKALNPFASQIRAINGKDIHDMTHEEQLGMLRLIVAVCEVHRLPEVKRLPKRDGMVSDQQLVEMLANCLTDVTMV